MELYKKHRPKTVDELVGQPEAVATLKKLMVKRSKLPHGILLTGPSGCGKTTIARALGTFLKCRDTDFQEMNSSDFRGIEMVRDIKKTIHLNPLGGGNRIYLFDEAHGLTKDAQNALLKMVEDSPKRSYFMFATTDPGKMLDTIKNRCTEIRVKSINPKEMAGLLTKVAKLENGLVGGNLSQELLDAIIQSAGGSARKALVILEQVIGIEDEGERLSCVLSADHKQQSTQLVFAMLSGAKWVVLAKILKAIDEDVEKLRRMVLTIAMNSLLSGGKNVHRASLILNSFRDPFFDSGKPGFVLATYEVCTN